MEVFIRFEDMILECTIINSTVMVRVGSNNLSPFYRTYKTDYLTVDCLINELLEYTNDVVISNNIYDVLEEEL